VVVSSNEVNGLESVNFELVIIQSNYQVPKGFNLLHTCVAFSRGMLHKYLWVYTDNLFKIYYLTHTKDTNLNKKTWSCPYSPVIWAVTE
jgi:hypothetical protein